ncbi:tubulin--tyrosine ligase [Reticulomyxa filosa]|uniref:Tubulin--tyrosine ligase-like protein 5 n=1 Tax=Reticulomyxa filosa TaxID=46433 RepID=X6M914_RETFI|nr:tubulin--tyrosine ligase [Reticulomyxa filosa]|eukprot:ETO10151.1 tubulin--tyrosine ligase [Reticulomyxa filosa]
MYRFKWPIGKINGVTYFFLDLFFLDQTCKFFCIIVQHVQYFKTFLSWDINLLKKKKIISSGFFTKNKTGAIINLQMISYELEQFYSAPLLPYFRQSAILHMQKKTGLNAPKTKQSRRGSTHQESHRAMSAKKIALRDVSNFMARTTTTRSISTASSATDKSLDDNCSQELSQSNENRKRSFVIRNGKMIGLKVNRIDKVFVIRGQFAKTLTNVVFHYLPVCQQNRILNMDQGVFVISLILKKNVVIWTEAISTINVDTTSEEKSDKILKLRYRISSHVWEYNAVVNTFKNAGFYRTNTCNWNVFWGKHLSVEQIRNLSSFQRINHFPGSTRLGRKDSLSQSVNAMIQKYGRKNYNIIPRTYILPAQHNAFVKRFNLAKNHLDGKHPNMWICKPNSSSCGRGIRLISDLHQLPIYNGATTNGNTVVVQEYVTTLT